VIASIEVTGMIAKAITRFSRIFIEVSVPDRIRKRGLKEYKDDSIELRRYLAAEIANKQFEIQRDRALTDVHRMGFMR